MPPSAAWRRQTDSGRMICVEMPGGDADERPADQRSENDDRRGCGVPAARPELDDHALGRGSREDERDRHRPGTSRAPAPPTETQSDRGNDRDERDPDRDAGTA